MVLAGWLYRRLGRSAFAEARLEALGPVAPGGVVVVKLSLEPRRPLELEPAQCTARFVSRLKHGERLETKEHARQALELPASLLHRVELRVELPVAGDVPASRPESADAPGYEAEAQVTIAIKGWPDLSLRAPVKVAG